MQKLREYAEEIAKEVDGAVEEVSKNNTKLIGVRLKTSSNISPIFYVDGLYSEGLSVEEAVKHIKDFSKNNNTPQIPDIFNFEEVKDNITLRLYRNGAIECDIYKSAEEYGFNDLIIVPYLSWFDEDSQVMSTKIDSNLLKKWDKSFEEVFNIGFNNIQPQVIALREFLCSELGMDFTDEEEDNDFPMYVVNTGFKSVFGAVAIIKELDTFRSKFPNGFCVLPSSVHEVLVVPYRAEDDEEELKRMVTNINLTVLEDTDILGDNVYIFNAE